MYQQIKQAREEVLSTAVLSKAEVRQFVVEFIYEDIIKNGNFVPLHTVYEKYDDMYPMITEPKRSVGPTGLCKAGNMPIQAAMYASLTVEFDSIMLQALREMYVEDLARRGLMNWHIDSFLVRPGHE
jgi:hypothetical protein